jgi:hypothetical protein
MVPEHCRPVPSVVLRPSPSKLLGRLTLPIASIDSSSSSVLLRSHYHFFTLPLHDFSETPSPSLSSLGRASLLRLHLPIFLHSSIFILNFNTHHPISIRPPYPFPTFKPLQLPYLSPLLRFLERLLARPPRRLPMRSTHSNNDALFANRTFAQLFLIPYH